MNGTRKIKAKRNQRGRGRRQNARSQVERTVAPYSCAERYPIALHNVSSTFMPLQFRNTMRFTASNADSTAAGVVDLVIRGNSIYDPYEAVGGEEVGGFDELAAIYGRYKVLGSRITVTVTDLDDNDPLTVCVFPHADATAVGRNGFSYPMVRTTNLSLYTGPKTVTHAITTARMFGVIRADDNDFSSAVTTNPAKQWYWHVVFFIRNAANALNLEYRLVMEYDTLWTELNDLAQT